MCEFICPCLNSELIFVHQREPNLISAPVLPSLFDVAIAVAEVLKRWQTSERAACLWESPVGFDLYPASVCSLASSHSLLPSVPQQDWASLPHQTTSLPCQCSHTAAHTRFWSRPTLLVLYDISVQKTPANTNVSIIFKKLKWLHRCRQLIK